jgi:hypothetical protein
MGWEFFSPASRITCGGCISVTASSAESVLVLDNRSGGGVGKMVSGSKRTHYRHCGGWVWSRRTHHRPRGDATHSERWRVEHIRLPRDRLSHRDNNFWLLYAESARRLEAGELVADSEGDVGACRARLRAERGTQDLASGGRSGCCCFSIPAPAFRSSRRRHRFFRN